MKGLVMVIIAGVVLVSACNQDRQAGHDKSGNLKGKITISGAFALYPMAVRWAEEFEKNNPRVKINISAGGAGKGMADALSGMVDMGMFSKEISPEELAKGAWGIPVAKDAVVPTISSANPEIKDIKAKGMSRAELHDIFITGKITTWGQALGTSSGRELQVFTRSDACGAADMWARYLNEKKQEDLIGIGVNGDPGLADALRKNPDAIGYNNLNFVYDIQTHTKYQGLEVIPLDLNGNEIIEPEEDFYQTLERVTDAIKKGIYPSPPARDLYFITKGKPTNPVVVAFLNWVLTDGQKFVNEAGYVTVDSAKIKSSIQKLK